MIRVGRVHDILLKTVLIFGRRAIDLATESNARTLSHFVPHKFPTAKCGWLLNLQHGACWHLATRVTNLGYLKVSISMDGVFRPLR